MTSSSLIPVVDTHHHLRDMRVNSYPYIANGSRARMHGRPSIEVYLVEDYCKDHEGLNVTKSVHIQTGWDPADDAGETAWLQAIADRAGFPQAIVGRASLADPNVERVIESHIRFPNIRGLREHVGWHPEPRMRLTENPNLMRDEAWLRGFALLRKYDLSFDLQMYPSQTDDALFLCRKFPDTPMIIGNLGMPGADSSTERDWEESMVAMARVPNTTVKLSGAAMNRRSENYRDTMPLLRRLIEIFGPDRCMFGTNFPTEKPFTTFAAWLAFVQEAAADLSEAERHYIFHGTAERVYRI
jgi:predicted TIM-barrel fold metal-dependent hydrolase